MRTPSSRSDDADVIRARLRALLADRGSGGWVPDDDPEEPHRERDPVDAAPSFSAVPDEPSAGLPAGIGRHRAPDRTVRWDPGRDGARSLWVAGVIAAALLVAWTWWDRPRLDPVDDAPQMPAAATTPAPATFPVGEVAETTSAVVVSVVGQVARPGLVTLPSGARVADAVDAVGGLLPGADAATVNLAAVVHDGEQIAVGVPGASGSAASAGGGNDRRVDLNTADAPELDALPGIGPVLAQRIVEHRTRHGPFRSPEQLQDVPGIGPSRAAELVDLVAV